MRLHLYRAYYTTSAHVSIRTRSPAISEDDASVPHDL